MLTETLHIYYSTLPLSVDKGFFRKFLDPLPEFLKKKYLSYKNLKDQVAGIMSIQLLIYGLIRSGQAPQKIEGLSYDKNNRPFLKNLPDLDFNISHSGEMVVCAVAKNLRVGIDIENHQPINIFNLKNQFTPKQWEALEEAEYAEDLFYQFWVQKEAALKADGSGLSTPLFSFEIEDNRIILNKRQWYYQMLNLAPGYSACVVTNQYHSPLIERVSL